MTPTPTFDELAASRYVRLTTFRKSGEGVPTPVWVTRRGDRLVVVTEGRAGKAKRLRNNPRVLLAPSDWRGNPKGADASGTVEIEGSDVVDEQTERARQKYGLEYKVLRLVEKVRRAEQHERIALVITLDAPSSHGAATGPDSDS
jgi:PPOX class probable F420-dependent enzyme